MTNAIEAADPVAKPLKGLYDFVREHVLIANSVIAASTTAVALMDFFAPRLSLLPRLVYTATALTVALMIVAALFPVGTGAALRAVGFAGRGRESPLWRRPAWQFSVALLLAVTALGFISVAKAERGGALADSFDGVRSAQALLLGLERATASIQTGVDTANAKLDQIAESVDPDNPADKCPDIQCAIADGASRKTIEKMLAKGQQLPGGIYISGYLWQLSERASSNRFAIYDIYRERGKGDMLFPVMAPSPAFNHFDAWIQRAAKKAAPPGHYTGAEGAEAWKIFETCVAQTVGGVTFAQFALIQHDLALYDWLRSKGAKTSEMRCDWSKRDPDMRGVTIITDTELERAIREDILAIKRNGA